MMAVQSRGFSPRGELRFDEPMSRHTSWRAGGPADQFFLPADKFDVIEFLRHIDPSTPVTWVGLGSNLLVRDGGVRGVVIATNKCLKSIKSVASNRIYIESGVTGARIARYSASKGLAGAEFFAGIPGTFGGALAMNAGAFGDETWNVVSRVEIIDAFGRIRPRSPMEFSIGYRSVSLPQGEWFLSGEILLQPGDGEQSRWKIRRLLSLRSSTQPIQAPSAGSVFRNPPDDHAARLIEATGLKGAYRGGAAVSEVHANFIVNRGDATAADIESLILHIQQSVSRAHGIALECEVRIIGDAR